MKLKHSVAGAVLIGAAAFSGSASAGLTGNVGAVSEYMFRGVSQSYLAPSSPQGHNGGDAAIQGGIDYAHDSGLYVGLWGSNVNWGAGNAETDFYGGYATKFGDVGIDVGAIYYYYAEYKEDNSYTGTNPNTVEAYAKVSYGPIALQYYYSPHYYGLKEPSGSNLKNSYVTLIGAFPLTDTLTFNVSVGDTLSSGDAWASGSGGSLKKSYIDYNVGLSKAIDPTLSASFSVIGSDLKYFPAAKTDSPKYVLGIKKTFDL